jgi:hypothetical protein
MHGALSKLQTIYLEHSHITINSTNEDAVEEVIKYWYDDYEDPEADLDHPGAQIASYRPDQGTREGG